MKTFKIGDEVDVVAVSTVEYVDDVNKQIVRRETEPFLAVIVGQAVKQLGRYSGGSHSQYFSPEYEPPSLTVTGTVTLWQVRTGMMSKPLLVQDDDLGGSIFEFRKFPRYGRKPKPKVDDSVEVVG